MANEKLLPAHVGIWLAYPEYAANPLEPTAAELNNLFVWGTQESGMVFNVSCATLDDYTLNQTESDTDDTRTICDEGEVSNPTFMNYEGSLDFLRDKSVTDQGIFNMAAELTRAADRPLFAIKRIGKKNTDVFAVGDEVSIFGFETDFPQDGVDSGEVLTHGARFKTNGQLAVNYEIAS